MAKHFSHPKHELHRFETQPDREIACSVCHKKLTGRGYECRDQSCEFRLHEKCFELPMETEHESHPGHTLALQPVPTYPGGEFQCDLCGLNGSGFVYHCTVPGCDFDVHVSDCDDEDELIFVRRGDLNTLYKLLEAKDAMIASYQMANLRVQNQLNLLNTKNLFRR